MKQRIYELDVFRGIAALLVVIFHLLMRNPSFTFNIGSTGVDLFFIISGFVILYSISKSKSRIKFIKTRFIRLFPIYWIIVSLVFLSILIFKDFLPSIIDRSLKEYILNLTMIQYYFKIENLDGPYWTLIIELNFYILILFFFNNKFLKEILLFFMVFVFLFNLFMPSIYSNYISFYLPIAKWLPLFISGIVFYELYIEKINKIKGFLLVLICYLIQIYYFNIFHSTSKIEFISFNQHLASTSIYYIIFFLLVFDKLNWIKNKYLIELGNISYVMYLIHQFFFIEIIIPILEKYSNLHYWLYSLICFPFVIIISLIIHRKIELPLIRLIKI